jgi:hypothetical protein
LLWRRNSVSAASNELRRAAARTFFTDPSSISNASYREGWKNMGMK